MTRKLNIKILGLGKSGGRIVSALEKFQLPENIRTAVIDTDRAAVESSSVHCRLLADEQWRSGRGTGGDVVAAQRSFSRERQQIAGFVDGADILIVSGGLGGGIATGGAPIVASVARGLKVPATFLMTMPFSFEGHGRRRVAENGIRELLESADMLLALPNDLLFSSLPPDVALDTAFSRADGELARCIAAMGRALSSANMLAIDTDDLQRLLFKRKSSCSIGVGCAVADDGADRLHVAVERVLDSALLGGLDKLKEADAVVLMLTGGADLQLAEAKKALEDVEKMLTPRTQVLIGVNQDPESGNEVQLCVLCVKFEDKATAAFESLPRETPVAVPVSDANSDKKTSELNLFEQGELPLQNLSRGIFNNLAPTMYEGEDLDIPTFQRRMINIDKGL